MGVDASGWYVESSALHLLRPDEHVSNEMLAGFGRTRRLARERAMPLKAEPTVRTAEFQDIAAITRFGEAHIQPHYAPLIGSEAADSQVRNWWNETHIEAAVTQGLVVIAVADGQLLGVGQHGRNGNDHVIYKLYVHPQHRGHGVGPKLLDALTRKLPTSADRLYIEHFAANQRAGAFYEREGFTVERIEPSPTGDPDHAQVWRVRQLHRPTGRRTSVIVSR